MQSEIDLKIDDLDIARAQKKRGDHLEKLLRDIAPFVINLCKKWSRPPIEPMDIAQESLLRLAKNIESFKFESKFSTWVYTITYRTFLDEARKLKRRDNIIKMIPLDTTVDFPNSDESIENESAELAFLLIDSLPVQMQEVLVLIDVKGLSYQEASSELKIPIGTLRSRLARARTRLKDTIASDGTFADKDHVINSEVNNDISD